MDNSLTSTRLWFSVLALACIMFLAIYMPDGGATTTAISTISIVVSLYVTGRSAQHIFSKKEKRKEFDGEF